MEEKKIDIKVDEKVALGQYTNLAAIRHTREEFIFDFAFMFPDGPMGQLVSRLILSPAHVKRFLEALEANVKRLRGQLWTDHSRRRAPLGGVRKLTWRLTGRPR